LNRRWQVAGKLSNRGALVG